MTFGQQQNVTPVPVTGSQNPPYQITSEKEQGQTYSTNFHAISMMPAYRNASFEVPVPFIHIPNVRNYDLRITRKVDDTELEVPLEHRLPLAAHPLERLVLSEDLGPILPIPGRQVRLDSPLRRILLADLVPEGLVRVMQPVHSVATLGPVHSAKTLPKPQLSAVARPVRLAPQPADLDQPLLQEDSVKRPELVPSDKNRVRSL